MSLFPQLEAKLKGSPETVLNMVLVGVVIFGVFVVLQKSRTLKLATALYFVLP